jgi:tRNA(fMet)-specific endonuclease VapC
VICLDTNIVVAAMNERLPQVRTRLEQALVDGIAIGVSTIVLYELWYGIRKSARRDANAAALSVFLALDVTQWPFDSGDAEEAGDIRAALERTGKPIGPYDLLIAAQARRRGALLATANVREFGRVPGLKIEDWSAPATPDR